MSRIVYKNIVKKFNWKKIKNDDDTNTTCGRKHKILANIKFCFVFLKMCNFILLKT